MSTKKSGHIDTTDWASQSIGVIDSWRKVGDKSAQWGAALFTFSLRDLTTSRPNPEKTGPIFIVVENQITLIVVNPVELTMFMHHDCQR